MPTAAEIRPATGTPTIPRRKSIRSSSVCDRQDFHDPTADRDEARCSRTGVIGRSKSGPKERRGENAMNPIRFYPLRFEPIYQYRLWGGRRLADLLAAPIARRRPDRRSLAAERPRRPSQPGCRRPAQRPDSWTIAQGVAGADVGRTGRAIPLVPSAAEVPRCLSFFRCRFIRRIGRPTISRPAKAASPRHGSSWKRGPTAASTRASNRAPRQTICGKPSQRTVPDRLASFPPMPGDGVFMHAGTVHALGDVVVFEVQENSDVTFRLYDWDRSMQRPVSPDPPSR